MKVSLSAFILVYCKELNYCRLNLCRLFQPVMNAPRWATHVVQISQTGFKSQIYDILRHVLWLELTLHFHPPYSAHAWDDSGAGWGCGAWCRINTAVCVSQCLVLGAVPGISLRTHPRARLAEFLKL